LPGIANGLQGTDAGTTGDREDDVGALVELGESHFLALGRVTEGAGDGVQDLDMGLAALHPHRSRP
jgi:hypothetical protein